MRRRVSAWRMYSVVLYEFSVLAYFGTPNWSLNGRFQHLFALHHFLETIIGYEPSGMASFELLQELRVH